MSQCALGPGICHLFFCPGAGHCHAFPARPPGIVNLKKKKVQMPGGLPGWAMLELTDALAEHVCYTKHEIAWENSKVITTNNRYGQRLWLEVWHINMSNHALNRDDGAYLPEEYIHLIGR